MKKNQIKKICETSSFIIYLFFLFKVDQEAWNGLSDIYLLVHYYIKANFSAEEILIIN
jgi:hypothetical protein